MKKIEIRKMGDRSYTAVVDDEMIGDRLCVDECLGLIAATMFDRSCNYLKPISAWLEDDHYYGGDEKKETAKAFGINEKSYRKLNAPETWEVAMQAIDLAGRAIDDGLDADPRLKDWWQHWGGDCIKFCKENMRSTMKVINMIILRHQKEASEKEMPF